MITKSALIFTLLIALTLGGASCGVRFSNTTADGGVYKSTNGGKQWQQVVFVRQDKKKLIRDKVKLPEEKGEYDIEYYLNHQILPAVENILQVFNIDVHELIDGKKQDKLNKWM